MKSPQSLIKDAMPHVHVTSCGIGRTGLDCKNCRNEHITVQLNHRLAEIVAQIYGALQGKEYSHIAADKLFLQIYKQHPGTNISAENAFLGPQ